MLYTARPNKLPNSRKTFGGWGDPSAKSGGKVRHVLDLSHVQVIVHAPASAKRLQHALTQEPGTTSLLDLSEATKHRVKCCLCGGLKEFFLHATEVKPLFTSPNILDFQRFLKFL